MTLVRVVLQPKIQNQEIQNGTCIVAPLSWEVLCQKICELIGEVVDSKQIVITHAKLNNSVILQCNWPNVVKDGDVLVYEIVKTNHANVDQNTTTNIIPIIDNICKDDISSSLPQPQSPTHLLDDVSVGSSSTYLPPTIQQIDDQLINEDNDIHNQITPTMNQKMATLADNVQYISNLEAILVELRSQTSKNENQFSDLIITQTMAVLIELAEWYSNQGFLDATVSLAASVSVSYGNRSTQQGRKRKRVTNSQKDTLRNQFLNQALLYCDMLLDLDSRNKHRGLKNSSYLPATHIEFLRKAYFIKGCVYGKLVPMENELAVVNLQNAIQHISNTELDGKIFNSGHMALALRDLGWYANHKGDIKEAAKYYNQCLKQPVLLDRNSEWNEHQVQLVTKWQRQLKVPRQHQKDNVEANDHVTVSKYNIFNQVWRYHLSRVMSTNDYLTIIQYFKRHHDKLKQVDWNISYPILGTITIHEWCCTNAKDFSQKALSVYLDFISTKTQTSDDFSNFITVASNSLPLMLSLSNTRKRKRNQVCYSEIEDDNPCTTIIC